MTPDEPKGAAADGATTDIVPAAASTTASTTNALASPPPAGTTDTPRRCFICLTDEEPSDPPGTWVDPCPCTLEAHQDCMLSWVTDCERSNKPLQCPVCKARIGLVGPWDPVVALTEAVGTKFTNASPYMLLTSVSIGVQFSLQMYGAVALRTFAGPEMLMAYISKRTLGGRLGHALALASIAPALLMGQLTPWLGNKIFVSTASLYGVYHFMHDEDFLAWPPSPQLAMTMFPYIRSLYLGFWREFVFPTEVSLNRRLMGLPPLEPREAAPPANNQRAGNQNGDGGVLAFLNNILDALDPEDEGEERDGAQAQGLLRVEHREEEDENGDVFMELVIEERAEEDDDDDLEPLGRPALEAAMDRQEAEGPRGEDGEAREAGQGAAVVAEPANDNDNGNDGEQGNNAPQAPPARRPGLGTILLGVSNAIVSALILPGISFGMGELLRLALPKSWSRSGFTTRPGLLQQQWGRSLVGGCLFAVMRDVLRLYTKYRKVANMGKRRVKNVENRRVQK